MYDNPSNVITPRLVRRGALEKGEHTLPLLMSWSFCWVRKTAACAVVRCVVKDMCRRDYVRRAKQDNVVYKYIGSLISALNFWSIRVA